MLREWEIDIPSLENIEILKKYLQYNHIRGCDLCPANNVLWSKYYGTRFMIVEDMLVYVISENEEPIGFSFPIGRDNHKKAVDKLLEYFENQNKEILFYNVNPESFEKLESWYPGRFKIEYKDEYADYVYLREKLAALSGTKLHGKRNHINRFVANYPDYSYEALGPENADECIALLKDWRDRKAGTPDINENAEELFAEEKYEENAIRFALNHMGELGLKGGLIRINDEEKHLNHGGVVAFTIGEPLTEDTFVVHFEKAYAEIQGAYAIMNQEFVKHAMSDYMYVNREEDLGIEGLRRAKKSYYPEMMIKKGMVTEI